MRKRGNTEKRIFAALAALILTGCPFAAQANVTGNGSNGVVVIENVDLSGSIYGWSKSSGEDASKGFVSISGDETNISADANISEDSYIIINGGYTGGGAATENKVEITGGTVSSDNVYIYGGETVSGAATSNSVTISGNANINTEDYLAIRGGYSYNGNATSNSVTISDNANITADNNYVNIIGGHTSAGTNSDTPTFSTSSGNEVNITGGTIDIGYGSIVGGQTEYGNTTSNSVTISGNANITADNNYVNIYGGFTSKGGSATENEVEITGGEFSGSNIVIHGGYVGDNTATATVTANENTVTISGGNFSGASSTDIYGGYTVNGDATDNEVEITGGEFSGSSITIRGGHTISGNATGNSVTLSAGTFSSADSINTIIGGYTGNGDTTGNTVTIGGTAAVSGTIYGGYIYSGSGTASNNSITLTERGSVSGSRLYGSNVTSGEGNTLYVDGWVGGDAAGVYNFNEIWFRNMEWETDATVLTITDNTVEGALSDTSIYLGSITIDNPADLSVGDTMTFLSGISDTDLGIQEDNVYVTEDFTAGVAVAGTGEVLVDENTVAYTITGLRLNTQTDLITETGAAGASFVANAADLISDALGVLGRDELFGTRVFGIVQGVKSKYDVSERLEITGWNVIAGVGNESVRDNGVFSWAAFYEGGTGNFHTWNRFVNELFHSRGGITYNGGGLAAKYEADNGFYTEASVRAGHMDTDMRSGLMDASGTTYGYDTESSYWGAHIGIGKILPISETRDLDIYGKFYHTEIDGDGFAVAGDWFDLHSITSNRLRVGARVIADIKEDVKGYYGLAWEYEFSGDAEVSAYNLSSKSSFGGSTGVAEAGITWRPNNDSRWLVDLNARGYIGEREGGSLSMMVSYAF